MSTAQALVDTPPPVTGGRCRWAVVGGGILGLELATRLRDAGHTVRLYEAAPHVGGLADAWQLGDVRWDRHYHVILMSDTRVRQLLDRLALSDDLQWVETKTGFFTDGKLVSMSNSWEFLKFPPLGLVDKVRLAATIMYASKITDWKRLEKIPVVDWLRKWSGSRTTEKIWLPLLRAKLGENYRYASAAFIWAIIARMYAARRTGLKKEQFGYLRGGYGRILDAFADALTTAGVPIRTSAPVKAVTRNGDFQLDFADGTTETADRVVVTTAAPLAARMCPELTDDERRRHTRIRYQGIVCASVLLRKPLAHYYVTNITEPDIPFTAVIEMTALVDPAEFGGRHLVYLPKYVTPTDPLFDEPDATIRESFLNGLKRMYPNFDPADVLAFQVSRVRNVLAVATLDYSEQLPDMATSVPGLYLVNSAHIVNGTLNVNETLQLADRAAARLLAEVPR